MKFQRKNTHCKIYNKISIKKVQKWFIFFSIDIGLFYIKHRLETQRGIEAEVGWMRGKFNQVVQTRRK
jgi:hypothetical protein